MQYHSTIGFGLLFIVILSPACNLLSVENRRSTDYPTQIPKIDLSVLQQMNYEFQNSNESHICSTLNEYGFTGYSEILFDNSESPCLSREVIRVEMNNQDSLLLAATNSLIKNSKFTGVEDTTTLQLIESQPLYGCTICDGHNVDNVPIEWKLTFREQFIDSTIVENTSITVFIDAKGVNRIWGNWYNDFSIPDFIIHGYRQIQGNMIGWEIDMRSYTGEEKIFTLNESAIREKPYLAFLPVEVDEGLEIRQCWAIPIEYNSEEFKGWIAYVDVVDGTFIRLSRK